MFQVETEKISFAVYLCLSPLSLSLSLYEIQCTCTHIYIYSSKPRHLKLAGVCKIERKNVKGPFPQGFRSIVQSPRGKKQEKQHTKQTDKRKQIGGSRVYPHWCDNGSCTRESPPQRYLLTFWFPHLVPILSHPER